MSFDERTKEKLLSMDNRSLQELISKISAAVGADEQKTRSAYAPGGRQIAEHGGQGKKRADTQNDRRNGVTGKMAENDAAHNSTRTNRKGVPRKWTAIFLKK